MTQTAAPAARRRRTDVPRYAVLVVTSLLFFAPVAYMVAASLAPASRTLAGFEVFDPREWGLHNYTGVATSLSVVEHRRASSSLTQHEAVVFELLVDAAQGVEIDAEMLGEPADWGELVTLADDATSDEPLELRSELCADRRGGCWIDVNESDRGIV